MPIDPVQPVRPAAAPAQPAAPVAPPGHESPAAPARPDVVLDIGVPPAPPPEVRAEVTRAAEVVAELHARNRELHFSKDPGSNRIVVEVRDLDGNVLRTIPPSEALRILSPPRSGS